jgi:hypothetical protein
MEEDRRRAEAATKAALIGSGAAAPNNYPYLVHKQPRRTAPHSKGILFYVHLR